MGFCHLSKKAYISLTIVAVLASTQFRTITHYTYNLITDESAKNENAAAVNKKSAPIKYWQYQSDSEIYPEEETIIYIITKIVNCGLKYQQRIFYNDLYPLVNELPNLFLLIYLFLIIKRSKNKISAMAFPLGGHAPPKFRVFSI